MLSPVTRALFMKTVGDLTSEMRKNEEMAAGMQRGLDDKTSLAAELRERKKVSQRDLKAGLSPAAAALLRAEIDRIKPELKEAERMVGAFSQSLEDYTLLAAQQREEIKQLNADLKA